MGQFTIQVVDEAVVTAGTYSSEGMTERRAYIREPAFHLDTELVAGSRER